MEFIYATIEDCINRIRSHKKEFPMLKSDVNASVDLMSQLSYDNRDRGVRDVFFIKDYTDSTANPIKENYIVPETQYPYPRYLKTLYANRILGFGTSAPSKLAEIFAFLGFTRLPSNTAFACLADGFGGFTAYIDTLTRRSKILFNTLIVDSTMEANPSDWDADRSRNEVEYEALKFHYHDLTLLTTIDKLIESFPYQPLVVTCDAQTVGMDMRLRENLLCNVTTYFLN
ncbi:unnamed protein product [Bemisia tabaci]|uniref:Uncharacterized protein n=1 Tax=Bemisia tabaci TaxID=7038 RepID=A0A9P0AK13_BEMTA|nr:unnamed protein product [Bemisia tabaci]